MIIRHAAFAISLALVAANAQAQVLDRSTLADRLAACSAIYGDIAAAHPQASRTVRVQYAAKNHLSLAMRLGERPQVVSVLERERKALAERRADPAQAQALDDAFAQRDDECNRLLEHNMALIDSLRDGR
ncbi:MAG: hypothetical protein RBS46_01275 [Methyloversatilis sp.]|jgi:hypothetical protein|nr:hypothetical protein [Methyloversatilis sp.]